MSVSQVLRSQFQNLLAALKAVQAAHQHHQPPMLGPVEHSPTTKTSNKITGSNKQHACPLLELDDIPGLPCMPTLNGWLLGYPAVYWVQDIESALLASRCLSSSQLHLFSIKVACPKLQAAAPLTSKRQAQPRGKHQSHVSGAGQALQHSPAVGVHDSHAHTLMAFSVPSDLHTDLLDDAVGKLVDRVVAASIMYAAADPSLPAGLWGEVSLDVKIVGPQAVSM